MTPRMMDALRHIEAMEAQGIAFTYQGLADRMGYANKSRAFYIVESLAERGLVVRAENRKSGVRLASRDAEKIPFDQMADAVIAMAKGKGRLTHKAVRYELAKSYAGAVA